MDENITGFIVDTFTILGYLIIARKWNRRVGFPLKLNRKDRWLIWAADNLDGQVKMCIKALFSSTTLVSVFLFNDYFTFLNNSSTFQAV